MLENIRLSFQGIWSHKMRSFLTMLGIIIGIGAIIAIVSTIQGTNEQIKRNLVGAGNNIVDVRLFQDDWAYEADYYGVPEGVPQIEEETLERVREAEAVQNAALYNSRQGSEAVCYKNTVLSGGYVTGIDSNYFDTCSLTIKQGRGFDEKDYSGGRKVAVLDGDSLASLFQGETPMGKTIEIKGEPFTVIGVAGKKDGFEPVIQSMEDYTTYMQESGGKVFIPSSAWPTVYGFDDPQNMVIRAENTDSMAAAGRQAADILNEKISEEGGFQYKSQDLLEQARELQELGQSTNRMLIWIAGISLLVGGIGVMNIMLVSVTERTREIGLKKAIGAKKSHILAQFLTEAAVLTSLGGAIGVAAGTILAQIISKIGGTPAAVSVPAAVIAVAFSMVIGIVFGLLPSCKAANLKPIDALRRE